MERTKRFRTTISGYFGKKDIADILQDVLDDDATGDNTVYDVLIELERCIKV